MLPNTSIMITYDEIDWRIILKLIL